ncbi:MAG: hypothetical protein PWQ41_1834 [Bacillota bacterium]|nr:hypothetical protein [Bacillota bacterium]MDK2926060.1 hypothetical protein [Bacillota bacterium]
MRLGLEEEVFITQPERPNLQSLFYLTRLFWRNPGFFLVHSDSNFARGKDIKAGLMGPVEISTPVAGSPAELVAALAELRRELTAAVGREGLLVAMGHLIDMDAPTLTAGLHLHLSGLPDAERAYNNLAHFLPLFALCAASSPARRGQYFGPSYRLYSSYALGPLRPGDRYYRFQDLIFSLRLGTIEVRLLDPVPDLERLRKLVEAIVAVATCERTYAWDPVTYRRLREEAATLGLTPDLAQLWAELQDIYPLERHLVERPAATAIWEHYLEHGLVSTYAALDNLYRNGSFTRKKVPATAYNPFKVAAGLLGYYAVRLPYKLAKVKREWSRCGSGF